MLVNFVVDNYSVAALTSATDGTTLGGMDTETVFNSLHVRAAGRISVHIRLDAELAAKLQAAADREHRSVAGYVRVALIERLGQEAA